MAAYAVTPDADSGVGANAGKFLCISAMPAYKEKQLEELRWEDYQAGDKGEWWIVFEFGPCLCCGGVLRTVTKVRDVGVF